MATHFWMDFYDFTSVSFGASIQLPCHSGLSLILHKTNYNNDVQSESNQSHSDCSVVFIVEFVTHKVMLKYVLYQSLILFANPHLSLCLLVSQQLLSMFLSVLLRAKYTQ